MEDKGKLWHQTDLTKYEAWFIPDLRPGVLCNFNKHVLEELLRLSYLVWNVAGFGVGVGARLAQIVTGRVPGTWWDSGSIVLSAEYVGKESWDSSYV